MLPKESKSIAKALKLPVKEFFEKHCILLMQAFPVLQKPFENPLIVPVENFPKKAINALKPSELYLVLPCIAFKRNTGSCTMLSQDFKCLVHKARPRQCALFPLISLKEDANLKEQYSFCKGLQGSEKADLKENYFHYKNVQEYFELIKKKGFRKVWQYWPSKGFLLLEKGETLEIDEKEFFQILGF
jgi:Fe-S-cluster containining protein